MLQGIVFRIARGPGKCLCVVKHVAAKESLDLTHYSDIDFENVSPNGKVNKVLTTC